MIDLEKQKKILEELRLVMLDSENYLVQKTQFEQMIEALEEAKELFKEFNETYGINGDTDSLEKWLYKYFPKEK